MRLRDIVLTGCLLGAIGFSQDHREQGFETYEDYLNAIKTGNQGEKLSDFQQDSIKLEKILSIALKPKAGANAYSYSFSANLKGKEVKLYAGYEKYSDRLKVFIGIDKPNVFEKISLGEGTIYLIHLERSRFSLDKDIIKYDHFKQLVNYGSAKEEIYDQEEYVLDKGEDFAITTLKKITGLSKTVLKEIKDFADFKIFLKKHYEKDKAVQEGNLLLKEKVYVEPIDIDDITNVLGTCTSKRFEVTIKEGEKAVKGIIIFYRVKDNFRYGDESNLEYEIIPFKGY